MDATLEQLWHTLRDRLQARQLLGGRRPALSLRIPGTGDMWFGHAADVAPRSLPLPGLDAPAPLGPADARAPLHAGVYALRPDVCAVASGGGPFGLCLEGFGGAMPGVFDEQVRHLGHMAPPQPAASGEQLPSALGRGGNVLLVQGEPLALGMTGARLALNAELFEKCAKAYVLAAASGGAVRPLPWIVRHVANRRLMKDEQRARQRVRHGLLPEESKGY